MKIYKNFSNRVVKIELTDTSENVLAKDSLFNIPQCKKITVIEILDTIYE